MISALPLKSVRPARRQGHARLPLLAMLAMLAFTLAGCLEVEQHPPWRDGHYDGKPDDRVAQTHFVNDRLAWHAVLINRNHLQNEYNRMP